MVTVARIPLLYGPWNGFQHTCSRAGFGQVVEMRAIVTAPRSLLSSMAYFS